MPFAGYTTAGINGSTSTNDVVKVTANDTLTANRQVAAVLLSGKGQDKKRQKPDWFQR